MYLLDTHTFLWYLSGDSALPGKIIETISKTEHVYLSVASLWEIAIKQSVNKLKYSDSIVKNCTLKSSTLTFLRLSV